MSIENVEKKRCAQGQHELTEAQRERLEILAEEAGEVVQMAMKTLRFGYSSSSPFKVETNKQLLEKELGHLDNAMNMMIHFDDVSPMRIKLARDEKSVHIKPYLRFQPKTGAKKNEQRRKTSNIQQNKGKSSSVPDTDLGFSNFPYLTKQQRAESRSTFQYSSGEFTTKKSGRDRKSAGNVSTPKVSRPRANKKNHAS